jgi:hypothetical protein
VPSGTLDQAGLLAFVEPFDADEDDESAEALDEDDLIEGSVMSNWRRLS